MAILISDADFQLIRDTINDVVETFGQLAITYKKLDRRTNKRFNRGNQTEQTFTDYPLSGVLVWQVNEKTTQVDVFGKYDFSEGYMIFGFDAVEAAGLVDNDNVTMEGEVDRIVIRGKEYQVIGVASKGQLKDKDAVVRVQIKKELKNG